MAQERTPGLKQITDPALHNRAAELFSRAVELRPEEQSAFLQKECGSNTDLLRLIENLLAEDRSGPISDKWQPPSSGTTPPALERLSGKTLSHYRIAGPMAAGGMGIIYRATETRLERTVALKFLPPFLKDDSASRERFLREARAIASIDHQNVCPVYEVDEADGFIFVAMAWLDGVPLEEKIRTGPIPPKTGR
jgi:eukaryotic-like serine/threonine-protein kinase